MERIALISDIHGNLPALEATLADIAQRGIARIFCLGDLVGKGPSSAAALERCRDVCDVIVQGNWDYSVAEPSDDHALHWHHEQLSWEQRTYLGTLPGTYDFRLSGKQVRLFHASQRSVFHRVHMTDTPEAHSGMFDNTPFTGDRVTPDIVGYGDIHVAFMRNVNGRCLFNVGSVGNALDGTLATYAVLEGVYQGETQAPWSVQVIRIPYDVELAIDQAEQAGSPNLAAYAFELRTGKYRRYMPNAARAAETTNS